MVVFVEPVRTSRTFEAAIENLLEESSAPGCTWTTGLDGALAGQLGISKPTSCQALRSSSAAVCCGSGGKGGGIFMGLTMSSRWTRSRTTQVGPRTRSTSCAGAGPRGSGHRHGRARRHGRGLCRDRAQPTSSCVETSATDPGDGRERHVPPRGDPRLSLEDAAERDAKLESELAAIRDTYQGGQENDRETLEIHERQVEAMRRRDMKV